MNVTILARKVSITELLEPRSQTLAKSLAFGRDTLIMLTLSTD